MISWVRIRILSCSLRKLGTSSVIWVMEGVNSWITEVWRVVRAKLQLVLSSEGGRKHFGDRILVGLRKAGLEKIKQCARP